MTTPATVFRFDTDALLSPISADQPTGASLRYEGTYDLVAALRREDDPQIAQGVWAADLKKADWVSVAHTCALAIETRSKDLQLAAWLLEACIHLRGFAGLDEGLHLMAELCDSYWDGLHPAIKDGDLDYRLAPLYWVDEKLSTAVKLLPVTSPHTDDPPAYSFADWEMASRTKGRPRSDEDGALTQARFQQSADLTPTPWLSHSAAELRRALMSIDELRTALQARCGRDAPSLSTLRDTVAQVLALTGTMLEGREQVLPHAVEVEGNGEPHAMAGENGAGDAWAIRTRAEAYQRLAEAADFLARIEPHSPVPPLIRRAIKWGSLTLEELLPELVTDARQLEEINRMLQLGEKLQP